MFKLIDKVFYSPEGIGSNGGSDSGLPTVDTSVTDKDILNSEDTNEDVQIPGKGRKGKGQEEKQEESSEEEVSDEESGPDDDEGTDGSEDESVEDDEDTEETEDEEDDEEEEEQEEESLDLADLTKSVKKLAPDLFKKIPGLREALEREKELSNIFPTTEDASQAARNTNYLQQMYGDIISGDVEKTSNFLKAVQNTNKEGFEEFSHTILDSIGKLNPQLYGEVMLKPMKKALMSMYADAMRSNNKNLAAVAIHAHNYWFDTQDIKAPLEDRKKETKSKEHETLEKEKQEFEATKLNDFKGGITEVVNHSMKLSITKELDGLKLDEYQKRNVIRDIFTEIDTVLGSDKRYLGGIQSLFDQAKSARYSSDWKSRIVKAYLQRARQALPAIRNKILREAGIKVKESPKSESRRLVPAGLGGNKSENQIDFSRVDRSRTTDMDILNGKPKYIK